MKKDQSVAIVGFGAVGRSMRLLFPDAVIYDEPVGVGSREEVNACRFAFVCVPTPTDANGRCETSIVEDVVSWLACDYIVLRSTVAPGTTDALAARYGKRVVFQPEYGPGETPDHPYADPRNVRWIILGGPKAWTRPVAQLYQGVFSAEITLQRTDAVTAELTKYMENAFLATKVAFCNEFFEIAERLGVDYNELRELWLLDPRIGRSHTWVHEDDRGFGGKCLPKDLEALLGMARELGYQPALLEAVRESNEKVRAGVVVGE
jgi:UDPglucose 6-dehydrogenase